MNVAAILEALGRVMPDPRVIAISPLTGEGVADWMRWLIQRRDAMLASREVVNA